MALHFRMKLGIERPRTSKFLLKTKTDHGIDADSDTHHFKDSNFFSVKLFRSVEDHHIVRESSRRHARFSSIVTHVVLALFAEGRFAVATGPTQARALSTAATDIFGTTQNAQVALGKRNYQCPIRKFFWVSKQIMPSRHIPIVA